jgi:hypothetical protein
MLLFWIINAPIDWGGSRGSTSIVCRLMAADPPTGDGCAGTFTKWIWEAVCCCGAN